MIWRKHKGSMGDRERVLWRRSGKRSTRITSFCGVRDDVVTPASETTRQKSRAGRAGSCSMRQLSPTGKSTPQICRLQHGQNVQTRSSSCLDARQYASQ